MEAATVKRSRIRVCARSSTHAHTLEARCNGSDNEIPYKGYAEEERNRLKLINNSLNIFIAIQYTVERRKESLADFNGKLQQVSGCILFLHLAHI